MKMWAIKAPWTQPGEAWAMQAFRIRKDAQDWCSQEWGEMASERVNWKILYRQGWRCRRVNVEWADAG